VDGVEAERPRLFASPHGRLAAVRDDGVLLYPLAVFGDGERLVPMGPKAAHAGALRGVERERLGGGPDAGEGDEHDRGADSQELDRTHRGAGSGIGDRWTDQGGGVAVAFSARRSRTLAKAARSG